jgi:hypothetical protein
LLLKVKHKTARNNKCGDSSEKMRTMRRQNIDSEQMSEDEFTVTQMI